jgi:protein AbiQ
MENLRIYRIEDKYINFLRSRDDKVQLNKNHKRPYVGVVLHVGEFRYFVPMESPKPNHAKIKSGKHILKIEDGRLGLLGFNNMVPVADSAIIEFDINAEPDEKYRNLLLHQVRACNKVKADVYNKAAKTYY